MKETDQAAAQLGGSELRDVHGSEDRRAPDAESTDEAKNDQSVPIPSKGAAQRGDEVQNGENPQTVAAPEALAGNAREHGAEDGSD